MPTSTELYKDAIYEHIKFFCNGGRILDVGAGYGTYGRALKNFKVDALEPYETYINEFDLRSLYMNVYCESILNFDYDNYDYIILGDVLEHIDTPSAIKLIDDISRKKIRCLVGVPYMQYQGTNFNFLGKDWSVEYEIHKQSDLTNRIMKSRYPSLHLFLTDNNCYGYYTNYLNIIF